MGDKNGSGEKEEGVKIEGTYKLERNENLDEYFRAVGKGFEFCPYSKIVWVRTLMWSFRSTLFCTVYDATFDSNDDGYSRGRYGYMGLQNSYILSNCCAQFQTG